MKTPPLQILVRLAQADTAFYLLPALMLLLVAGTIAQKDMGLYDAHRMFFASFYFRAGPLPLPGGYTLCGLLTAGLALKFILNSEWSRRKAGINLAHFGALVLLGGGLLTALTAREGYMIIPEGQETPYVYDYHDTQLSAFIGENTRINVPFDILQAGDEVPGLPFRMAIRAACENCGILRRAESGEHVGNAPLRGMARFMALQPKPREIQAEANMAGLTFDIRDLDTDQNGVYIAFDAMPEPVTLEPASGPPVRIVVGKVQRELPFSVYLSDFKKETYPGLEAARAYSADVIIRDNGLQWPARIEMNAPLRYKGYTFYQSSFDRAGEQQEITILSVVENKGRLFPYIGTLIIAAGLILHLVVTLRTRRTA